MRNVGIASVLIIFMLFCVQIITAENYLDEAFSNYNIERVGIYTESYPDTRSSNFVFEVAAIKANGIIYDSNFFRYRYCNYDLVTLPLTTPEYPLNGTSHNEVDTLLYSQIDEYLSDIGWKTSYIDDFTKGSLTELLRHAAENNLDAVLVVRYTEITYILPIENYSDQGFPGEEQADTGKIKKGKGLIPAIELFDVATGNRLWYSAYHTGHQIIPKKQSYQHYAETADKLFAHTAENTDAMAVKIMLDQTLKNDELPFPPALKSFTSDGKPVNSNRIKHLFWTDYPSYGFYGTKWGIGYGLEYIGAYNINYKDTYEEASTEENPVEHAGTIPHSVFHKIYVPFFSIATHNLSLEPSVFLGVMPSTQTEVQYTDIQKYKEETKNDYATTTITTLGVDLSLKYFLRLSDKFSVYLGGKGSVASWWQKTTPYTNPDDSYGFTASYKGLYTNYNSNMIINAAAIFGVKWESRMSVDIFGSVIPVGPGGGLTLSVGIMLIPFTYGFIDPHATNISSGTRGY